MKEHTIKQKKEVAERAVKMQKAKLSLKEIAELIDMPVTKLKHWVKDFRDGKFDEPVKETISQQVMELKAMEQIDIRPELLRIAKAIEDNNESTRELTKGMVKVCIRLDYIYKKNEEDHQSFNSLLVKGLKAGNGEKT